MNPPKISVILPLYNCAPVIARAVASLRAQTLKDFECLLVDDCGPDREGIARAETLTRGDPRFRLIRNPRNLGLGGARNTGVAHATGEWLAFMDQDDLYYPDALRLLEAEGQRFGADVVEGRTLREPVDAPLPTTIVPPSSSNGTPIALEGKALAARVARMYLAERDGMHLWNRLYRRAWWGDRCLDSDIPGCDDALFCAEHLWQANRLVLVDGGPTYRFSVTPGSQSANLTPRWMGLMCRSFVAVWHRYTKGLLQAHPDLGGEVLTQLRWVLAHWIVDKCFHHRRDYDAEGRRAIADAVRAAADDIGLTLPLKARWRLWRLSPPLVHIRKAP